MRPVALAALVLTTLAPAGLAESPAADREKKTFLKDLEASFPMPAAAKKAAAPAAGRSALRASRPRG